jgi:4-amino-4-deoxy-L-arabinose transferase-like glycosyltransferase
MLVCRWHLAMVGLVTGLALFAGLGRATLWEPDEPRFAESTREMFERGDFLTPHFNGAPRFEKPILLYWLQAAAFCIVGETEFGARLPGAIAGLGTVFLVYLLTSRVATRRAALVAALALATMFRFVTIARTGLTDIPVLFFIVGALYGFVHQTDRGSRVSLMFAWSCVGIGILTKGPVGLLPVAVWATYAAVTRDVGLWLRVQPMLGLPLAFAIAVPWYGAMAAAHGRGFVDFALDHEIVERAVAEASFAPTRSFLYYFKVWPGDAAPWSALFVAAAIWTAARWRTVDNSTRKPIVFALAWFLCVFLLFSFARSKVTHYVLPAYPAAALLIGVFVDRLADTGDDAIWWRVPLAAIACLSIAAALATALMLDVLAQGESLFVRCLVPAALMTGGTAIIVETWRRALLAAVSTVAVMLAIVFAMIGSIVIPRVIEPLKPMPLLARGAAQTAPDAPLGLLGGYGFSSLVYYSHGQVQLLDDVDTAVAFLSGDTHPLCVMPAADFEQVAHRLGGTEIVARGEEFNVRIERLLERRKTPGREWVLVRLSGAHRSTTHR